MTDAKAKKLIDRKAYATNSTVVWQDEHVTFDPNQWFSEIAFAGRSFCGCGETKGKARIEARRLAAEWIESIPERIRF